MPLPDALIRRVTLDAIAAEPAGALQVLHVAEAVLRRAVEAAAATVGGEIVLLRRVDLHFYVDIDRRSPMTQERMEQALFRALVRRIGHARQAGPASTVTAEVVWFPSEAAAIGDLLAAFVRDNLETFYGAIDDGALDVRPERHPLPGPSARSSRCEIVPPAEVRPT